MLRFRAIWRASIDATKKALTWSSDDLMPPSEKYIYKFNSKEELKRWHLYSDSEYGGLSPASLEIKDTGNGSTGVFFGNLPLDVTEGSKWKINRSGFCGMRSKKVHLSHRYDIEQDVTWPTDCYQEICHPTAFGFLARDLLGAYPEIVGPCPTASEPVELLLMGSPLLWSRLDIYTENWVNSPGQQEDNSWQAFAFIPKDDWYIYYKGSGKSTIAGQLLVLNGRVDKEQMQEDAAYDHGRPDSYLSYLMDTSEEVRDQGRTLELGIERFESEGKRFMIFDTPAQKINPSDMFLGMFGVDIAVVVFSALSTDKGINESLVHTEMAVEKSVYKIVIAINHLGHPDESIYNSIEEIVFPFADKEDGNMEAYGITNWRCMAEFT